MSVQVQLRRDTDANILLNKGAVGEVFVDTTVFRTVVQDNATLGGWPAPITLFVGNNGTVNNSNTGSGAFVNHTPTFTIPANFMVAARAFRLTTHFQLTTGTTVPILAVRLSLGVRRHRPRWQSGRRPGAGPDQRATGDPMDIPGDAGAERVVERAMRDDRDHEHSRQ